MTRRLKLARTIANWAGVKRSSPGIWQEPLPSTEVDVSGMGWGIQWTGVA